MLSIFPMRDFQFINFNISFFLTENDGNKALQLFCGIAVAMVFFIYLYLSCNDNYFVFSLYDDEINLPTLLSKHCINSVYDSFYHHVVHHEKTGKYMKLCSFVNKILRILRSSKDETPARVFSREFCEICEYTIFSC